MRARIFNIMQYQNHPETNELLLDELTIQKALEKKSIIKFAYVLHDKDVYSEKDEIDDETHIEGEPKPAHWHIVIQCRNQVETHVVAKWFNIGENFVDVPKGFGAHKFLDCVQYLTHEHERQQILLGKHRYEDDEITANFDFRAELDKRAEVRLKYGTDLDVKSQFRFDVLYNGKTIRQCIDEDKLNYMNDWQQLEKLRQQYLNAQNPPTTRVNYYIHGKSGFGKGLMSRALARSLRPEFEHDDDIFFVIGKDNISFDGYDGQPIIIWDDVRASDLKKALGSAGNIFRVFDTHPVKQRQNVKYSTINLVNEVNIVNSPQPHEDFLDEIVGCKKDEFGNKIYVEDANQSYRRFPMILPLHENDFDIYLNKGFMDNTSEFQEYYEYKNFVGNMQKIRTICQNNAALIEKYEQQMVLPILEKAELIDSKFEVGEVDEEEVSKLLADFGKVRTIENEEEKPNEDEQFEVPF